MVSSPVPGQLVIVRYRSQGMPLQGKVGTIHIVGKAKRCRNHGVVIRGRFYVIPCGNLFNAEKDHDGRWHPVTYSKRSQGIKAVRCGRAVRVIADR